MDRRELKTKLYGRTLALGSVVIVLVLAVAVALRLPGAIITVAALGLPLLLVICWLRAGVLRALPRWAVLTTVALSIGLAKADDPKITSLSAGWLANAKSVGQEAAAESWYMCGWQ